jgi:hypothetical protein
MARAFGARMLEEIDPTVAVLLQDMETLVEYSGANMRLGDVGWGREERSPNAWCVKCGCGRCCGGSGGMHWGMWLDCEWAMCNVGVNKTSIAECGRSEM